MSTASFLKGHAYQVPPAVGEVRLVVANSAAQASTVTAALMHRSPTRVGMRIAGGCSGMSAKDKAQMLEYFEQGFRGFSGFVSSGGTRQARGTSIDPMVTDVPALLAHSYGKRVLTLSTVPRTGDMALRDQSRLVLDTKNNVSPQPGVHMLIVFQPSAAHAAMDWDGDVEPYFSLFRSYTQQGWRFGMVVWNGGGVTKTEAHTALQQGWKVITVAGSGRAADELARDQRFITVDRTDPTSLNTALHEHGFIA